MSDEKKRKDFGLQDLIDMLSNMDPSKVHIHDSGDGPLFGNVQQKDKEGIEFLSKKYPGVRAKWGSVTHSDKGGHMAQVCMDAAESEEPVELSLSNGRVIHGRILAVSAEVVCLEAWGHFGPTLERLDNGQQVYVDLAAIDAMFTLPGEYEVKP